MGCYRHEGGIWRSAVGPKFGYELKRGLGVQPSRRVLVLVNPISGKGKGKAVVKDTVMPILHAAGCTVEVRGGSCALSDNTDV